MEKDTVKSEIGGKRLRHEETRFFFKNFDKYIWIFRHRRVLGEDELREGVNFLPVDQMLRLAATKFTFLRAFMRHRGKAAVLGELQDVNISDVKGIVLQKLKRYYWQKIPPDFHIPPEELMSILRLNINRSIANSQPLIELIRHFAPLLKDHGFSNFNCNIPFEQLLPLLIEFESFHGIELRDNWSHERFIRMPFVMRSKILKIDMTTLDLNQSNALID